MIRDGGCRVDQCSIPAAWCEVDHLVPVSEGGLSDLINMALLCSHHHHLKHAPGVQVIGDALHFQLRLPNGRVIDCPTNGIHQRRTQAAA
ncbi:MAG: HNH endonuclease signature motif containing protein [Acidimicrobiales bacterium]